MTDGSDTRDDVRGSGPNTGREAAAADGGDDRPTTDDGDREEPRSVVVACQGGGSHTAFTAGVLQGLFADWDHDRHELVGISGTSGGAFNALVAWYGLVTADEERAVELLDALWTALEADGPLDRLTNDWLVGLSRVESAGVPVPGVSPYQVPGTRAAQERLRTVLEGLVDFEAVPELCGEDAPKLVVGTVDVEAGAFETFVDERVTVEAVLASAAIPALFEAVEIDGRSHWDGIFSQNPPISDLVTVGDGRKPDEFWVVQVNPQRRETVPTSLEAIADRRNELAGNLSLNQELRFIERVNDWLAAGYLPEDHFSHIEVRRIVLDRDYPASSKLDRSPAHVRTLLDHGRDAAGEFLESLGTDEEG